MTSLYKAFPPGWNNIRVPTHRRGATLAGIATYTPCLPKGNLGQRAAWALVRAGGARVLPGKATAWEPPLPAEDWNAFDDQLRTIAGDFDSHTVYERRRGRRGLLMLLMRGDRPLGFVKAQEGDPFEIDREGEALSAVERTGVLSFIAPRVLGAGTVAGWRYLVTSPMPPKMHRMLRGMPDPAILEDIATSMAALPQPDAMPAGWQPFHGDYTPWNLRRIGRGKPWLIDWEDAGWAPPDADRVLYVATSYALGRPATTEPLEPSEAVGYWRDEINRRVAAKLEAGLNLRPLDYGLLESLSVGVGD